MKIINKLIVVLAFFSTSIAAQEELSLSDAIRLGLENNYDLQVVRNSENISAINNTWGNTSVMPRVNFTVSGRENYNINDTDNYLTQTLTPDLGLNWTVFDGFAARINKSRFEELEEQSKGNTAILVESTIQDIILAYYNCQLQYELQVVAKEFADLSKARYDRAKDSKEMGVSTSYDILQAQNAWLSDASNYLSQKVNYENTVRNLNYILATDNNKVWSFTTEFAVEAPNYVLNDMLEKLKSNNKTLKNQYLYQSLLAKETALAKSDFFPSLSLNAGLSNTSLSTNFSGNTPDQNNNSSAVYGGLTFSYNIFSGGSRKRGMAIAKINEESAQTRTDQMTHSLTNQMLQVYSTYEVRRELLSLADEQAAAAKLNLELSKERLQNGSINSFNYRDVQLMYMNAAISKNRAVYNLIQSNTDLLRISGGIINEYE